MENIQTYIVYTLFGLALLFYGYRWYKKYLAKKSENSTKACGSAGGCDC
ncbi:hypothetical protein [Crocinitomix catalasitica]|nr:hypothetical protein [Crocinitomix catalasitica]